MTEIRMFKRIGAKVREEACDLVEAKLPEQLRKLLDQLDCAEKARKLASGHAT